MLLTGQPLKLGRKCRIHHSVKFRDNIKGIKLGKNVKIDENVIILCTKGSEIIIGDNCHICTGAIINSGSRGSKIELEESISVGHYSVFFGNGGLKIGKFTRIAPHVQIMAHNHILDKPDEYIKKQGISEMGIEIEEDVWLGGDVKVLDGVTIGKGAVIGAGGVVTKDIEPYSINVGVPVKKKGSRKDE